MSMQTFVLTSVKVRCCILYYTAPAMICFIFWSCKYLSQKFSSKAIFSPNWLHTDCFIHSFFTSKCMYKCNLLEVASILVQNNDEAAMIMAVPDLFVSAGYHELKQKNTFCLYLSCHNKIYSSKKRLFLLLSLKKFYDTKDKLWYLCMMWMYYMYVQYMYVQL